MTRRRFNFLIFLCSTQTRFHSPAVKASQHEPVCRWIQVFMIQPSNTLHMFALGRSHSCSQKSTFLYLILYLSARNISFSLPRESVCLLGRHIAEVCNTEDERLFQVLSPNICHYRMKGNNCIRFYSYTLKLP